MTIQSELLKAHIEVLAEAATILGMRPCGSCDAELEVSMLAAGALFVGICHDPVCPELAAHQPGRADR
jgi:hypothetical protein